MGIEAEEKQQVYEWRGWIDEQRMQLGGEEPKLDGVDPFDYNGRKVAGAISVTIVGIIIGMILGAILAKYLLTAEFIKKWGKEILYFMSTVIGGIIAGALTFGVAYVMCSKDLDVYSNRLRYNSRKGGLNESIHYVRLRFKENTVKLEKTINDWSNLSSKKSQSANNAGFNYANYKLKMDRLADDVGRLFEYNRSCIESVERSKAKLAELERWQEGLPLSAKSSRIQISNPSPESVNSTGVSLNKQ